MSQIELTFPNGDLRSVESGITGLEIAKSIAEGLARKALGVKLNDKVLDLTRPLTESGSFKIITPSNDDQDALMLLRHSCSHVLADSGLALTLLLQIGGVPEFVDFHCPLL